MRFSISRKVFSVFLLFTLSTVALGVTINVGLNRIGVNNERMTTLVRLRNIFSEFGHFHSDGEFHLNFHVNDGFFQGAIETAIDLCADISTWNIEAELPEKRHLRLNEEIIYYRNSALELLINRDRERELRQETQSLLAEMRAALSQEDINKNMNYFFGDLSLLLAGSTEEENLLTVSKIKDILFVYQDKLGDGQFRDLTESVLLNVEKRYLNQLSVTDRQSFLSETSRTFNSDIEALTIALKKSTDRQKTSIRSLVTAIIALIAFGTLSLWALSMRRVSTFLRNFRFSINSIARGDHGYDVGNVPDDELGDAIRFMKELAGNLQARIREQENAKQEKGKLEEQLLHAQKMESVGRLAGGVAHDFNNLLMGISGYCELAIIETPEKHPLRSYFESIQKNSEKAANLTAQLLAFSRRQILERRPTSLNEVISSHIKMLQRIIGEDIILAIELQDGIGNVLADSNQIEQVLMNLAVNARDSMPDGGRLSIATTQTHLDEEYCLKHHGSRPGDYIQVSVADSGEGIPLEYREKVFEPFFTTKEIGKGTGLGLATVYGIVKQHEGNIWLYSEVGKGTTFKIFLPVVKGEEEEDSEEEMVDIFTGSEKILIVDDNSEVLEIADKVLASQGYRTTTAASAGEGLDIIRESKRKFDLLLTDVVMPGMGGRELAEKAEELVPTLKVIFMSGYADNSFIDKELPEGEDVKFLQKPVMPSTLLKEVRQALDGD